jgi:hypothetical protein
MIVVHVTVMHILESHPYTAASTQIFPGNINIKINLLCLGGSLDEDKHLRKLRNTKWKGEESDAKLPRPQGP